ncbi:MAG: hypothetical protein HY662_02785 [Chloroflexi bacterium]|nr:hypothetical protein [Chloroflexota bacterium]
MPLFALPHDWIPAGVYPVHGEPFRVNPYTDTGLERQEAQRSGVFRQLLWVGGYLQIMPTILRPFACASAIPAPPASWSNLRRRG